MYIKKESRKDSKGKGYPYYRFWESYRDELGLTQKRPVLGLGRMDGFDIRDLADFIILLDRKSHGSQNIFPGMYSPNPNKPEPNRLLSSFFTLLFCICFAILIFGCDILRCMNEPYQFVL